MTTNSWNSSLTVKKTTSGSIEQYLPVDYLLWISNEKQYEINRPTVIITIISIILGLIGNILVIYVFGFCFKRTTANIFVSCLAVSDTFTCFLLCFETLDLRYPMYSGNYPEICKTVRFLEVFCHSCSSIFLVCIAMDRFYKICKPLIYISPKKVKRVLTGLIISMLLLSWPVAFIHGPETVVTPYPQVNGKDCADDDNFKGSLYSGLYFFLLLIITLCCIFAVVILYCRIYWAITKWKFSMVGEKNNSGIWSTGGSSKLPFQRRNITEKIPSESREIQRRQSRFVILGEKYESSKNQRISSAPESPESESTEHSQSHSDQETHGNSQSVTAKLSNETHELQKPSDKYPNTPRIIIQEPGVREDGNREETVVQRRKPKIDVDQTAGEPFSSIVTPTFSQIETSEEYERPKVLKRSIERSRIYLRASNNIESLPDEESTIENHPSGFGGNNNLSNNLNTYMVQESHVDSSISKSSNDSMIDDSDKISDVQFRRPKFSSEETPIQRWQSKFVLLGKNYEPSQTAESYLVPPISVYPDIASSKRYLMKDNLKRSLSLIKPVKSVRPPVSHRLRTKSVSFHLPVKNDNLKAEPTNSDENSKPKLRKVEETSVFKESEDGHSKKKQRSSNVSPGKAKARLSSTTVMFSLAALFYVLSYIPILIVEAINAVQPLNLKSMSYITRQLIVMANSAYFFNLSFNPIIYGVFNKRFQKEMGLLLKGKIK